MLSHSTAIGMVLTLIAVAVISLFLLLTTWLKPRGKIVAGYCLGASGGGCLAVLALRPIYWLVEWQILLGERAMTALGLRQLGAAWAEFLSGQGFFFEAIGFGMTTGVVVVWFIRKQAKSRQR